MTRLVFWSTVALVACNSDSLPLEPSSSGSASPGPLADASLDQNVGQEDAHWAADTAPTPDASDAQNEAVVPRDAFAIAISDSGVDSRAEGEAAADSNADGELQSVGDADGCKLGPAGEALDLRCAGLYADWGAKTISVDARPYDPGLHLWSDGANKQRWIQLPAGKTIDTTLMDNWSFPVGTKFWKEFASGNKRIETRLLWKGDAGSWYATTYRWSADESSATELTTGALNADGNGFEIPSQLDCATCHQGRRDYVLGFEAVSFSTPTATGLTMATLTRERLLSSPPTSPIQIPGTAVEQAALGYLHTNCGTSCHNPESPGDNRGFYMRLAVSRLSSVHTTDTWNTGWNVPSFSFPGTAGTQTRIAACSRASSSVYYRMTRRDGVNDAGQQTQMPPIATHKVDDAGVGLIAAWIDETCPDGGR